MAGFFIPGIGQGGGANPNPNPDAFTQARFDAQTNELVLTTAGGVAIPVNLSNIKPAITQGVIKKVELVGKELVIEDVDGQIVQIPLSRVLGGVDITLTQIQGIQSDNVQGAIEELNGKFIEDITFDTAIDNTTNKPKNTLKKTKNGTETNVINHVVTDWQDLEYTERYTTYNALDFSKVIPNKSIDNLGNIGDITSNEWGIVEFNVEQGEYTVVRQRGVPIKIILTGEQVAEQFVYINNTVDFPIIKNWHRYVLNVPQGFTKATMELKISQGNEKQTMVLRGNQTQLDIPVDKPIPFTDKKLIQVSEVSLGFDNSNSSLTSTTVESAIKELNKKIANAGGGTVTSVNGEIPVDGNVALISQVTQAVGQDIVVAVGDQANFATLECMTNAEADLIIDGFVL